MQGSKLTLLHPDFPAPFAEKAIRFVFGSLDIPAEKSTVHFWTLVLFHWLMCSISNMQITLL